MGTSWSVARVTRSTFRCLGSQPDRHALNDDVPHAGEIGYYEVPAISLTNKCENYDPEFLLLWLPNEKLYGAWDSDDWYLFVFPGKTWTDIVNDPRTYITAMWFDFDREVSAYFKPYPNYQYIKGRPFLKIAQRIRIDCVSEANHDLIRLLNKPGVICGLYI